MDGNTLKVALYKVGQNLNVAYRICEFFGVKKILLCQCNAKLSGNLFKAKDNVELEIIEEMPVGDNVVYFETNGKLTINDIEWSKIDTICIGGETHDFRHKYFKNIQKVKIQGYGKVSGLTVSTALAIALNHKTNNV